ncbi:MAG: type II toxin-antitoxin system VapC family toxin [Chloroflexales bacterium]|nr:type II toxin-antitoxin system VapC family toxin [Chloroflexales bacterium]
MIVFTLDASVFLRRASPNDPDYAVCRDLLEAIKSRAILMYEPLLVLPEVAGAVSRIFRDPMRGRVYADLLRDLPNTTYVPIDAAFSREAEELAADYLLRGADATYAVVARRYACTLVSLD